MFTRIVLKTQMINRKIDWLQSIDDNNKLKLNILEKQLADFYASNPDYYTNIDFTSTNWIDTSEVGYQEILKIVSGMEKICEVGCGSANMLKHHVQFRARYSGFDFSDQLMKHNQFLYPEATFRVIEVPNTFPFDDESFDVVFSVFVIEHSTDPSKFLNECSRILKPGGSLVILCPDFLGSGHMTSQRAGWSQGTAQQKLRKGKFADAIVTLFDNRIRIPFRCRQFAKKAARYPLFLVNAKPVVFDDPFSPDVDAVYVTYKIEIEKYLSSKFKVNENTSVVSSYESERRIIFLSVSKF
jgi:ubiquinone/menaquinone biosynthesis C-methylase UbiE